MCMSRVPPTTRSGSSSVVCASSTKARSTTSERAYDLTSETMRPAAGDELQSMSTSK